MNTRRVPLPAAIKPGYVCPLCGWVSPLVRGRAHRAKYGQQHRGMARPADVPLCKHAKPSMTQLEIHQQWPSTGGTNQQLQDGMSDQVRDDMLDGIAIGTADWRAGTGNAQSAQVNARHDRIDRRLGILARIVHKRATGTKVVDGRRVLADDAENVRSRDEGAP